MVARRIRLPKEENMPLVLTWQAALGAFALGLFLGLGWFLAGRLVAKLIK